MPADQEVGSAVVRAQYFDAAIKQIAKRLFKFKKYMNVTSTGAWTNYFFREKIGILAGAGTRSVKGIPRNANFPQAAVEWERISTTIEKYGLEDVIPWEDLLSDEINVRERTAIKIAEGVVKAVDDAIWQGLGGNIDKSNTGATTSINQTSSFSIVGLEWNETSAAILDDLFRAKQLIGEQNYSTENLICFISERDHRSIMKWVTDKGTQFPQVSENITDAGKKMSLAGIELVVSNSVTASNALIIIPNRTATWKELVPLQTSTIEDKYKNVTIRAVELGVLQLTDPKACVRIMGTQSGRA